MSNVVKFKNQKKPLGPAAGPSVSTSAVAIAQAPASVPIGHLCLAVAYYVNTDKGKEAKKLLTFMNAFSPVPKEFHLPQDLAELVKAAEWGVAMFPPK